MKLWKGCFFFIPYAASLSLVFFCLLLHRSTHPLLFGRYSAAYSVFLLASAALLVSTLFLFFDRRQNNLRRLLPHFRRESLVKALCLAAVLLVVLVQLSLYPGFPARWGVLWFPVVLIALFLTLSLASTRPGPLAGLLALERTFASRCMGGVVAFAVSFLVCLVLVECALRLWQPTFVGSTWYAGDPKIGFRMKGGMPDTNSLGFRDLEFALEKPEGVYRIVALGDSFAFGSARYEAVYLTLLEELLNERLGRRVEILNMGVPAYAPKEELRLLKNFALKYRPDHVMVNFFMGNDLTDNKPTFKDKIVLNGVPFDVHTFPAGVFLFNRWYLPHYLKVGLLTHHRGLPADEVAVGAGASPGSGPGGGGAAAAAGRGEPAAEQLPTGAVREHNKGLAKHAGLFLRSRSDRLREHFDYASSFLLDMKEICDERGVTFSIALLPEQLQVDSALRRRVMRENGLMEEEYDFEAPSRLFEEFGLRHGIPVFDLMPFFKKGCEALPLYRPLDSHWNTEGNRLAAEALAEIWVERELAAGRPAARD